MTDTVRRTFADRQRAECAHPLRLRLIPCQQNSNAQLSRSFFRRLQRFGLRRYLAGATFADVELMKKYIGKDVKVKAAGGISSFDDAEKFISLGAERLGTSRLIKILKNTDTGAGY